jgi:anti-sigma B factor antagonist
MATLAEKYNDVVVISVEPELTDDTIQQFRRVSDEQLDGKNLWFVVDMEKAASIDSSGLETLLWFRDEVESHTGLVKICAIDPTCRKVFELTRFDRKFEVFDTATDAIKSYE